ncbi:TRAP transporter small permease subunit [Kordiimonas pumila]|uniref:TRAP transporter small permease protein n=1 Tax=Kordiimonas pumila TaxID=2161677 RepID=A0ABV7D323_9PROT|nr:TRAP transporter small permease subunit [Kordiimonas pumila]
MFKIMQFLDFLNTRIAKVAVWIIPLLVLVIMTDITLRHWFVIGSTKLQELEWHLHGALFLFCLGWAYIKNAHVRIELFAEKFSARTSARIELLGCLLFLMPYCLAILYFGIDYIAYSFAYGESSASATGLPYRWIMKSGILAGFSLLLCAGLTRSLEAIIYLYGPTSLAHLTFYGTKPVHMSGTPVGRS